jgi:hypothetical protein
MSSGRPRLLGGLGTVLVLALLLPATATSVSRTGEIPIRGLTAKKQSVKATESKVLRQELSAARTFYSRTGVYVFVAESTADWDHHVAPGLAEALQGGPDDLKSFATSLPSGIGSAGPDIAGGMVRFELPDGRGRGVVAVALPDLVERGRADSSLTNAKKPNTGLFLSGVSVKPDDEPSFGSVYVPGRPRSLTRGRAPTVEPRDLPSRGRGALTIFRGQGGSGDEGEDLRDELSRFLKREDLPAGAMRSFPKKDELVRDFRTFRVATEDIEVEEGWYRALSRSPDAWKRVRRKVTHPTRYVVFSAPVAVREGRGDDGPLRSLIVGGVALYTPLLMTPSQAALWSGQGTAFFEAIHSGEVPFLRDRDDVYLFRGHVDRWAKGRSKSGNGKARTYRKARRRVEGWADKHSSRGLNKAASGPLPFRFVPIPDSDREALVDATRAARGRVFQDDLVEWMRHHDAKADLAGPDAVFAMRSNAEAAVFQARLGSGGGGSGGAVASRMPKGSGRAYQPKKDEAEEASGSRWSDSEYANIEDGDDDEDAASKPEPEEVEEPEEDDFDLDAIEEVAPRPPSDTPYLEVVDVYPIEPNCRPGQEFDTVVAFVVDNLSEGETASLSVEWDITMDGKSLTRDALPVARGSGEHEVEITAICPRAQGDATIEVLVDWEDAGLSEEARGFVAVRGAYGRSWAKLSMPSPKQCTSSSFDLDDDEDFSVASSQGLDSSQIMSSVRAHNAQTMRCASEDKPLSGKVLLEFIVGCDGRVTDIEVIENSTFDNAFGDCVADVMKYTSFPGHDQSDGAIFQVPLIYE